MPDTLAEGAWIVYGTDMMDYPMALFGTEVEALRWANDLGYYARVKFWEWGEWTR